jgi:3-oxoacyl-[acyl-carrier protein] reductase
MIMAEQPVLAITGTSRGIGLGMAEYFVGRGYRVAGCSRSESPLTAENYLHTLVDLADEKQVRHWFRAIKNHYGRLDILVCNAASHPRPMLLALTSAEVVAQALRTNVMGTYLACREAVKVMLPQQSGRIITISSVEISIHEEGTSVHSTCKSAVVEMTKVLAKEVAAHGITCNVVALSLVKTETVKNLGEEAMAHTLERLTIKREVTTDEICNVVEFFAGPRSGCITGQILYTNLVN